MSYFTNYTPEEVLNIFRINQRVWSCLDNNVEDFALQPDSKIYDWRVANDLVKWPELYRVQNDLFELSISQKEWLEVVLPEDRKTMSMLCEFIAKHAKKEVVEPVKLLGKKCLHASIFLSLKRDLSKRGLDVHGLRPDSLVSMFTTFEDFPKLVAEVAKRGATISNSIRLKHKEGLSFLQRNNIFNPHRFYIDTGTTRTFRDLTYRIGEVVTATKE